MDLVQSHGVAGVYQRLVQRVVGCSKLNCQPNEAVETTQRRSVRNLIRAREQPKFGWQCKMAAK